MESFFIYLFKIAILFHFELCFLFVSRECLTCEENETKKLKKKQEENLSLEKKRETKRK